MSITISFHLNKRSRDKSAKELAIIGRVNYSFVDSKGAQNRTFKFSTGYTCPVNAFKKGRVDGRVNDASHINSKLSEFVKRANTLYTLFDEKRNYPQPEVFKEKLYTDVKQVEEDRDFVKDFEEFIRYHENKGSALTTIRNLKQTLNRLNEVAKDSKHPLDYSTINLNFYAKFKAFCDKVKLPDGSVGLKKNTFGGHIKLLKTFLNYAKANGWNKYEFYKHREFKIASEKVEIVTLNEDEVKVLAEYNLSNRPRLALSRDFFVLGCETGLRYIDYSKISKRAIKEVKHGYNLEVKTQKTGAEVIIPLSQLALDILIKYQFQLPEPPKNQKLNENLKTIAELSEVEKNITTHTARRTFATNQYNAKTPVQWIMQITGHKTEREFYKYIGVGLNENADKVREMHEKYQINKKGLLDRKLKIA